MTTRKPASSGWTDDELTRIGETTEHRLAARRPNTTMWVVRVDDDLYVRSAGRPDRPWYRHAIASRTGHIRAGGIEREVVFGEADPSVHDAANHAKYDRYGPGPVSHVTGPNAHPVTLRLVRSEP